LDALQREITLLKDLHHENIVQYLGKFLFYFIFFKRGYFSYILLSIGSQHDENSLNIFLEYVPGGSVATMLNNYGPLEETLVRSFNRQILQGLNYLHEKDIIHRDIKGANILGEYNITKFKIPLVFLFIFFFFCNFYNFINYALLVTK
jgi:mitogen-activated protein kinase kinase kinase